jgi:hypothetical protein
MVFRIDRTDLVLDGPDAFDRFDIVAGPEADLTRLGAVADNGEHVFVAPDTVRALAGEAVTPEWEERFAGMVGYAASKGWLDEVGRIRAHVERATS